MKKPKLEWHQKLPKECEACGSKDLFYGQCEPCRKKKVDEENLLPKENMNWGHDLAHLVKKPSSKN